MPGLGDRTVGLGVRGVGVRGVTGSVGERGVAVAVLVRVGVGLPVSQPKSGVRHTPGVVPGVGRLQSLLAAHEKSAKAPPSQKRPVEAQLPPGQWAARRHPKPWKSPLVHTFCVPTQARPAPQVPSPGVIRHESPANTPPWQVPSDPVPTQVPPGQSHGKPSKSPPSHTPWTTTHAPKELGQATKQSSSAVQATPSRGPPEHTRPLVTCVLPARGHATATTAATNKATPSFFTVTFPRLVLLSLPARVSQLEIHGQHEIASRTVLVAKSQMQARDNAPLTLSAPYATGCACLERR